MRYINANTQRPALLLVCCLVAVVVAAGVVDRAVLLLFPLATPLLIWSSVYHLASEADRSRFLLWLTIANAVACGLVLGVVGLRVREFSLSVAAGAALFAAAVTVVLGILLQNVFADILSRFRAFIGPGQCQSCGYDLTGLPSNRCPECGTIQAGPVYPPSERERINKTQVGGRDE